MSYEQTLKAVDDILRTDAGCATPIDYIEQTSWILFLKYLSDLESERYDEATLKGKDYSPLFTDEFKWDCDHDLKGYTALCCDCYFELGCQSFYEMGLDC